MHAPRATAASPAPNTRVRIVVSGEIIHPITDDEKRKRGFVDAAGEPKRAKVGLRPSDQVRVIQLEWYQRNHSCQMCGAERKSQRVLLLENLRTREQFHAAGDCLRYHFGLEIEAFYRAAGLYRRVLEKLSAIVGVEPTHAGDTPAIVEAAIARLERLERYKVVAVSEARHLLERIMRQPAMAASGDLDAQLRELDALIELQLDFDTDARRFEDRWRALERHPNDDLFRADQRESIQRAVRNRHSLSLRDHAHLVDALAVAHRSSVPLRNAAIEPWNYPDREKYQNALRQWAAVQPHNERRAQSYSVNSPKDQRKLEERLQRAHAARGDRRPIAFWLTALERSQLERMGALPNEDTLVGHGAQVERTEVMQYHENLGDPTSRRVRQGICVFYFDRWYEAYACWFRWKEHGGRAALEVLGYPTGQGIADAVVSEATLWTDGNPALDASAIAQQALNALPDRVRSVLGVDPTPSQLEFLRKPWIMACIANETGDSHSIAAAQEDLAAALLHLGWALDGSGEPASGLEP